MFAEAFAARQQALSLNKDPNVIRARRGVQTFGVQKLFVEGSSSPENKPTHHMRAHLCPA